MTMLRSGLYVVNRSRHEVIADRAEIATSSWARAKGLIGRRRPADGFALVIRPCNGVHTLLMSFPLDVVYVDYDGRIITILHEFKPWRVGPIKRNSAWVIEFPAGAVEATRARLGDLIEVVNDSTFD